MADHYNQASAASGLGAQQSKPVNRLDRIEGEIGHLIEASSKDLDRLASLSSRVLGNPPALPAAGVNPAAVPMGQVGNISAGIDKLTSLREQICDRISELEQLG